MCAMMTTSVMILSLPVCSLYKPLDTNASVLGYLANKQNGIQSSTHVSTQDSPVSVIIIIKTW